VEPTDFPDPFGRPPSPDRHRPINPPGSVRPASPARNTSAAGVSGRSRLVVRWNTGSPAPAAPGAPIATRQAGLTHVPSLSARRPPRSERVRPTVGEVAHPPDLESYINASPQVYSRCPRGRHCHAAMCDPAEMGKQAAGAGQKKSVGGPGDRRTCNPQNENEKTRHDHEWAAGLPQVFRLSRFRSPRRVVRGYRGSPKDFRLNVRFRIRIKASKSGKDQKKKENKEKKKRGRAASEPCRSPWLPGCPRAMTPP